MFIIFYCFMAPLAQILLDVLVVAELTLVVYSQLLPLDESGWLLHQDGSYQLGRP